jgi:hypothetical protein
MMNRSLKMMKQRHQSLSRAQQQSRQQHPCSARSSHCSCRYAHPNPTPAATLACQPHVCKAPVVCMVGQRPYSWGSAAHRNESAPHDVIRPLHTSMRMCFWAVKAAVQFCIALLRMPNVHPSLHPASTAGSFSTAPLRAPTPSPCVCVWCVCRPRVPKRRPLPKV